MQNIKADLDEMQSEAHISEQKAQSAMIDAARLADELRAEQVDIFTRTGWFLWRQFRFAVHVFVLYSLLL